MSIHRGLAPSLTYHSLHPLDPSLPSELCHALYDAMLLVMPQCSRYRPDRSGAVVVWTIERRQ